MENFKDGKKVWRVLSEREANRRRNLEELRKFMEEIGDAKKSPKTLLRLAVYTDGIKANDAAEIIGVSKKVIRAFMIFLLKRRLVEVESVKHPNPTIKATKEVQKKVGKALQKNAKPKKEGKKERHPEIERILEEVTLPHEHEFKLESVEKTVPSEQDLWEGEIYLVTEGGEERAQKIYKKMIEKEHSGLYITRENPRHIKERLNITECEFIWITQSKSEPEYQTVSGIQDLSISVGDFLEKNKNSAIILDGLQYLIANNNFQLVHKLIQQLRDKISITDSIMLIPINPDTLEERQLPLLKAECKTI